jgi:hypothetical protein
MQLRRLVTVLFAASFLSACTINIQAPPSSSDQNAAATIVAQTLQAIGTPLASPTASSGSSTASATPDTSKPVLSITGDSNCRTGPGANFAVVTGFTPGTDLEIVAQDTADNYWLVKIPNTEETCWVWGKYATAKGDLANIPQSTPTAEANANAPARPGSLFYNFNCSSGTSTVSFSWADVADNETGYHVYRGDQLIADLPAGSVSYTDSLQVPSGSALQYSVAAYNNAGESAKRNAIFTIC